MLSYPFPDPNEPLFYRKPRSFLGTIYYDRLPCGVRGPVDELPCPSVPAGDSVPTSDPSMPPPSTSPETREPAGNPTGSPPPGILFVEQTPPPAEPPTEPPTMKMVPTLPPTTYDPTTSPIVPMRAYIVTTLRNVPDRDMMSRESEKYVDVLTAFLKVHTADAMVLEGIDVWHSQLTQVNSKEGNVVANSSDDDDAINDMKGADGSGGARSEEEGEEEEDAAPTSQAASKKRSVWDRRLPKGAAEIVTTQNDSRRRENAEVIPQVTAMEVTLVLRITFANLPSHLLGRVASVAIQENEQELINLLHQEQAFYTFFEQVDGVGSRTIDQVTPPPTDRPTSYAYYNAPQEGLLSGQEVGGGEVGLGKS